MDIKNLCNDIKGKATKHSPEILIGVGIAGMFSSVVMAVKATPKVYPRKAGTPERNPIV